MFNIFFSDRESINEMLSSEIDCCDRCQSIDITPQSVPFQHGVSCLICNSVLCTDCYQGTNFFCVACVDCHTVRVNKPVDVANDQVPVVEYSDINEFDSLRGTVDSNGIIAWRGKNLRIATN